MILRKCPFLHKRAFRLAYFLKKKKYLNKDIPVPKIVGHGQWIDYLSDLANEKGKRVLEIGGRAVIYGSFRPYFTNADYTSFDYYPGDNVDIVGDAHKLSSYFKEDEKFDLIFSSAVFEHLAMPWLVSPEIAKLLKPGGYVFIESHFAFSTHERPWDFYRYSDMGLKALFPPALGFECIEAGLSNPIIAIYSKYGAKQIKNEPITGLYCHSGYLGKKVKEVNDFCWSGVKLEDVTGSTEYPKKHNILQGNN